jgi:hypothetical protein
VELGSGEAQFEPVTPDEHRMLYAGSQGGHHVWLSFRTRGLVPEDVRMELDVVPERPARPAHSEVVISLEPVAGDSVDAPEGQRHEFEGWPAQVLDPECAAGGSVSISLTLTDSCGRSATGSMTVIADPPTLGFTTTCRR